MTQGRPQDECDLVMKGGITSGVVYPPAILELAKRYRFRSVGGASAGAIAAAIAAAAELGREHGGFDELAKMSKDLAGENFLLGLLTPRREAEPLYQAIRETKEELSAADGRGSYSARTARGIWERLVIARRVLGKVAPENVCGGGIRGAARGAAVAIALFWPAIFVLSERSSAAGWVLLAWAVAVLFLFAAVGRFVGALVGGSRVVLAAAETVAKKNESFFGICTGMPNDAGGEALTSWLASGINRAAGRAGPDPLVFRDLAVKDITLRMVTTNLSQGQPYLLPLASPSPTFLFAEKDMEKLFPPDVVAYLVRWGREEQARRREAREPVDPPPGYGLFPFGDAMPVVVATRLSLSFPILLSAVRLYAARPGARDKARKEKRSLEVGELEEHWFSDGGIASNFPIHVFDAWMPTRPTFGFNLCDSAFTTSRSAPRRPLRHPRVQTTAGEPHDASVFLPLARDTQKVRPATAPIEGPVALLKAVFDTAQTFRDNAQAMLPSYRERVVHIGLDADEGGLNLDMPAETIQRIEEKGREAARKFLNDFDFDEHRWVRSRVLLARIEHELDALRQLQGPAASAGSLGAAYRSLLQAQLARTEEKSGWYKAQSKAWCDEAANRADALFEVVESWATRQAEWHKKHPAQVTFFRHEGPIPSGVLRVTPEV